jgi:hypothetical protein
VIVPVAILAVPAIVRRNYPFTIAFVALIGLLLLLGLGYHDLYDAVSTATKTKGVPQLSTAVNLLKASVRLCRRARDLVGIRPRGLSESWYRPPRVELARGGSHPASAC